MSVVSAICDGMCMSFYVYDGYENEHIERHAKGCGKSIFTHKDIVEL